MIEHPFFKDAEEKSHVLANRRGGQPEASAVSGRLYYMPPAMRVLAVVGTLDGEEVFMMWPLTEFRGVMTSDWKTLRIAMASADVIVEGERLNEIVRDLASLTGISLRPSLAEDPTSIFIASIRIVTQGAQESTSSSSQ